MREILLWIMEHQTILIVSGFALGQALIFVILLVAARRVRLMKKKMDQVCGQVNDYLNVVLDNEEETEPESSSQRIAGFKKDEEENRIISTVLQEIFP